MNQGYFHRLANQSLTRFWINNPTIEEAQKAIKSGAISCTTNPTYTAKLLKQASENPQVMDIIDRVIRETKDNSQAAAEVQRQVIKRLLDVFRVLYKEKPGSQGFVSIQGDPYAEDDYENIIVEALADMKLGDNVIAKIPVTKAGLKAMEYLIGENVPIIATEVMGISQAVCACELYEGVSHRKGVEPAFYVTHITGIFDEYLAKVAQEKQIEVAKDILWQAGTIVARKQYRILKERGYHVTMLGGGARGLHHFTEMVGSDMHITINWKGTADKLLEMDPPIVCRIDTPIPDYAVSELMDKIPDFSRAYLEDGLSVKEFADFGPVRFFRDSFEAGWSYLLETIKERRKIIELAEERVD